MAETGRAIIVIAHKICATRARHLARAMLARKTVRGSLPKSRFLMDHTMHAAGRATTEAGVGIASETMITHSALHRAARATCTSPGLLERHRGGTQSMPSSGAATFGHDTSTLIPCSFITGGFFVIEWNDWILMIIRPAPYLGKSCGRLSLRYPNSAHYRSTPAVQHTRRFAALQSALHT